MTSKDSGDARAIKAHLMGVKLGIKTLTLEILKEAERVGVTLISVKTIKKIYDELDKKLSTVDTATDT